MKFCAHSHKLADERLKFVFIQRLGSERLKYICFYTTWFLPVKTLSKCLGT